MINNTFKLSNTSHLVSRVIFVYSILVVFSASVFSQKFKITIEGKYSGDTIIIGNFYGDKQLIQDTLFKKGKFWIWAVDSIPKPGVYFALLKPKNTYFQILINGSPKETDMRFTFDENELENLKTSGTADNKIFNDYVQYLKDKRILADSLRARIDKAKVSNQSTKAFDDQFADLDKQVMSYQDEVIRNNPNTLSAMLLKANQEIDIPEFTGNENEIQLKKYQYYKEHYFDNIPLNHPALIRTPFLHQKYDFYINKAVSQDPDTIIKAIDRILTLSEPNQEVYDYYLSQFLNTYGQFKMVGHDAIVVHLTDNYYLKGKARWSTPESLEKLNSTVADYRPNLIGKIMPNFTTYTEDGSPITLHNIKAKYTIMIAWDPTCGNCKKTMPFLVDFYLKHKDKDVKIISVCSLGGEKSKTCWPFIVEKNMQDFINTGDEYQRWQQMVRNNKVPKIYIMDANKKILMKDMSGEDFEKIFLQIYDFDNKKSE